MSIVICGINFWTVVGRDSYLDMEVMSILENRPIVHELLPGNIPNAASNCAYYRQELGRVRLPPNLAKSSAEPAPNIGEPRPPKS